MLVVRSLQSNSSMCDRQTFWRCATDIVPVNGGRRGLDDRRHPSLCRSGAYSTSTSIRFDLADPPPAEVDAAKSVGAKLAALLNGAVLVCLNIHTFWSRDLRSLTMSLRNERRVFRVCDIPASTGWFFQHLWPGVEHLFSQLVPAFLLLLLALYGLCVLYFGTHKTHVREPPNLIVTEYSQHVRLERVFENEKATLVVSAARRRRPKVSTRCRAAIERREHLLVMLLLALLTSVASLLNGATHFVAVLNPMFGDLSTREWLLGLLISHSLHLLIQCVTLPLCLALSARFRSHFCALFCFCMRRRHCASQQCELVVSLSRFKKAERIVPCV